MTGLYVRVDGIPAPQGSKRHVGNGVMIESSARVRPWREAVKQAVADVRGEDWQPITCPVHLTVTFYMTRPRSHYGTGRNAHLIRPSAPVFPAVIPDLSKLIRSTEDALTEAGAWRDDSQVTRITACKAYSTWSGASILISKDK